MGVVVILTPRDPTVIVPTLHDPASVIIITIRLSPSLRKKHQGGPEQPRFIEGRAPLLDIKILLLLLVNKAQPTPQNDRPSVLESILLSFRHPPCVLVHFPHFLCRLHLVPLEMSLRPKTTTGTTTATTTMTLLVDNLEDQ